jgi:hypothetical protein
MPFLPSSGALSINDIRNLFGGPASPSMANYYRGGAFIPATKSTSVREPSSGQFFIDVFPGSYLWTTRPSGNSIGNPNGQVFGGNIVNWNNPYIVAQQSVGNGVLTSATIGGATYFRGTFQNGFYVAKGNFTENRWGIFRETTTTTSINTGIPTSGQISISQFYGAEKP